MPQEKAMVLFSFNVDLIVYPDGPSEPNPFSANANTYYTPQVNIPATPPRGVKHLRTTSKEESLIFSSHTKLALKAELCAQYETDLKARNELVEILGKKLSDIEREEGKRKSMLRSWKKKVQELERTCRQLEEAMDCSQQESMERSVMDEASGEALWMLHRQIANLESEKADWVRALKGRNQMHQKARPITLSSTSSRRLNQIKQLWSTQNPCIHLLYWTHCETYVIVSLLYMGSCQRSSNTSNSYFCPSTSFHTFLYAIMQAPKLRPVFHPMR